MNSGMACFTWIIYTQSWTSIYRGLSPMKFSPINFSSKHFLYCQIFARTFVVSQFFVCRLGFRVAGRMAWTRARKYYISITGERCRHYCRATHSCWPPRRAGLLPVKSAEGTRSRLKTQCPADRSRHPKDTCPAKHRLPGSSATRWTLTPTIQKLIT